MLAKYLKHAFRCIMIFRPLLIESADEMAVSEDDDDELSDGEILDDESRNESD